MSEREWIVDLIRRRVEEADEAILGAPALRDGGRYRAALEGRWRGLHELLRELDPTELPRAHSTRTMRELHEIAAREAGW
ncbi:MAG: hypothetical protein LBJ87_07370 [bacterium]|jgi:hypothetical protein|nr:hypothetical protein [bacterium]